MISPPFPGLAARPRTGFTRTGLYRYDQIAAWASRHVAAWRDRWNDADFGIDWEALPAAAATLAEKQPPLPLPAHTSPVEDETLPPDPSEGDDDPDIEIEAAPDLTELLTTDFAGEDVIADPHLGILFTVVPADTDNLKLIRGIGPVIERKLNDRGVFQFRQIAHWSEAHALAFARDLFIFERRVLRDRWIQQARSLSVNGER